MKIHKPLLIAVMALGSTLMHSQAQVTNQAPANPPDVAPPNENADQERPHHPPAPPLVLALDADHDKTISATEIANAPTELLTLDKNKDGELTRDELMPPPPQGQGGDDQKNRPQRGNESRRGGKNGGPGGPGGQGGPQGKHHPPMPLFMALDTDKDGKISSSEISNSPASLKTLDKNKDGQLTGDEIHPPRPPMPPKDGGHDDNDDQAPVPPTN